jgi:hypothetical protein
MSVLGVGTLDAEVSVGELSSLLRVLIVLRVLLRIACMRPCILGL